MDMFIVLLTFMTLYKYALGCGEKITLNSGVIQSSDIIKSDSQGQNCSWVIHTPDNTQLVLVFKEFNIGDESTEHCADSYIQITDSLNSSDLYGKKLCGTTVPAPVISLTNVVHVNYTATVTVNANFKLEWKISGVFEYHNTSLSWPEAVRTCAKDSCVLAGHSSFTDIQIQQVMTFNNVSDIWTGKYLTPWTWLTGCVTMTLQSLNSLNNTSFKTNQQKVCQNHCFESNFYGLKGTKCYCLEAYSGTMGIPGNYCTDGCPGNHDERCGGDSALTLYRNEKCWDNSIPYQGTISNTYSGKTCVKWSNFTTNASLFPSGSVLKASNYCRDPNKSGYLWCYTSLSGDLEKCTIPQCIKDMCWDKSEFYTGTISSSASGKACVAWSQYYDEDDGRFFPSGSVVNASNYCRDPDKSGLLWCYTSLSNVWEHCTSRCLTRTASSSQYMCMESRYNNRRVDLRQTRCDHRNKYICRGNNDQLYISQPTETWHSSRDKCREKHIGLADKYGFDQSYHWTGYFRNNTIISEMKPNTSPDYCYNMQKNNDEIQETTSLCKDIKAFVCQKDPITCGESIRAYNGNITYPSTGNGYGPLLHCIWTITVDTSSYDLTLQVDIEPSYNCTNDFLKIYHGNTTSKDNLLKHVCGNRQVNLTRLNGTITIQFKSDMTINGSGFNIAWLAGSNGDGRTKESNNNIDQSSNDDKNATQGGLIAGICGGLIAIVAIVVVAFIFFYRRNKKLQVERNETVSTIATSNHINVHTHTEYVNTSVDTPQLYGNLDAGNHPPHANAQTPDKSDEGIPEYETVGDNSTRETSFSLDPDTYTVLNQDHNQYNEHEYGSICHPGSNHRE